MKGSDKDKQKAIRHPDNVSDDITSSDALHQYDPDKTQISGGNQEDSIHDAKTQMNWSIEPRSPGRQQPPAGQIPEDKTVIRGNPNAADSTVVRGQPNSHPQQGRPQQGHPQQGQPQQSYPPQGHPQQGQPQDDGTVIRNQPQNPDATVVRNQPGQADATVMRNQTQQPQQPNDATRVNPAAGQHARPDATRISPRKPTPPPRQPGEPQRRPQAQQPQPSEPETIPPITASSISPTSAEPFDPNKPRVLKSRFLLEKVLGVGGMGIVYKAKDRLKVEAQDRDPYVAIKVLSEEFKRHPEAFIALQRESRKSQKLTHENTVKVYDFDRDGEDVFMTMEFLEGKALDVLLRQYATTGLPHDDVWEIAKGMCSALSYAHKENIVHSDFKPGNVFYTSSGVAKVFDFGIARAVANVDRNDGKTEDKTVFDAGSLGALTPAYASLEMLQGKTPDVRDDIYALGCVIYELFTGQHPFGKMPADEAQKKGLKPKRIDGITKRQWRAIERSLAFKRSDRTETVDELYKELTAKFKFSYVAAGGFAVMLGLLTVIYYQYTTVAPTVDVNAIEYKINIKNYKQDITGYIENPTFTPDWEANLLREVKELEKYLQEPETGSWLKDAKRTIYELYGQRIIVKLEAKKFKETEGLIANAYEYTDDTGVLDHYKNKLAEAVKMFELERKKRLARKVEDKKVEDDKYDKFNVAHKNVKRQLQCTGRLDMRDFAIAIRKLQETDNQRYLKMEKRIVSQLSACIVEVGKSFPERANQAKKSAMRLFKSNPVIARIKIAARDACDISIAGLGASGSRTVCRDKIRGIGTGPAMVVIPGSGNIKPFAIGKFEVSVEDINLYCKHSKKCQVNRTVERHSPATNISVRTAKRYLKWLSDKTGQKYRLPSDDEWLYAANSRRRTLDSNRNCFMRSGGIHKGTELVKTTTGKQNGWGLVNHVGNAREWVYGNGRKLIAVGGSYKDSMDACNTRTKIPHNGKPDGHTGFRVIRELKGIRS